ncbi:MAG: hypothetical protein U0939_12040 [Pirellulales bacterium]
MIIERKVRFGQGRGCRKKNRDNSGGVHTPTGRVPRVARIMALAIRFDQLIRDGVVTDQAELARMGHVSRARLTQIMNLLSLAPEIQEEILLLPTVEYGRNAFTEKRLRTIVGVLDWRKQLQMWNQ